MATFPAGFATAMAAGFVLGDGEIGRVDPGVGARRGVEGGQAGGQVYPFLPVQADVAGTAPGGRSQVEFVAGTVGGLQVYNALVVVRGHLQAGVARFRIGQQGSGGQGGHAAEEVGKAVFGAGVVVRFGQDAAEGGADYADGVAPVVGDGHGHDVRFFQIFQQPLYAGAGGTGPEYGYQQRRLEGQDAQEDLVSPGHGASPSPVRVMGVSLRR